jgi:hypothetical protein
MAGIIPAAGQRGPPASNPSAVIGGDARAVQDGARMPSLTLCPPPTRTEADRQRRQYLAKADELEWDAITMLADSDLFGGGLTETIKRGASAETLEAAAKAYRQYARAISQARPSLPEREGDARARAVAQTMSHKFRELFGLPMYGLTAKIASVVLNRQITPRTVRYWVGSAVKPQKIAP